MIKNLSIGFIGAGRVTRIILEGLQRQNGNPKRVVVHDSNNETVKALKAVVPTVEITSDTYLWYQLQSLRELAAQFGLTEYEVTPALKRMVYGSARTLLESRLSPSEVMDLVPIKPLAELEPQVTEAYRERLSGLYQKIKP
jgi:pyrroline-5-carboxylate reductase